MNLQTVGSFALMLVTAILLGMVAIATHGVHPEYQRVGESSVLIYDDGTRAYTLSDGTKVTVSEDGTHLFVLPDGNTATVYEDGSYVTSDGRHGCLPSGLCQD